MNAPTTVPLPTSDAVSTRPFYFPKGRRLRWLDELNRYAEHLGFGPEIEQMTVVQAKERLKLCRRRAAMLLSCDLITSIAKHQPHMTKRQLLDVVEIVWNEGESMCDEDAATRIEVGTDDFDLRHLSISSAVQ